MASRKVRVRTPASPRKWRSMFRNTLLPWHRRFHGAIQIRRGRHPAQNNQTGGSLPAPNPGRNAVVITFAKMTDHAKPLSFRPFATANACGTTSSKGRLTPEREPDSPLSGAQSRKPLSLHLEP